MELADGIVIADRKPDEEGDIMAGETSNERIKAKQKRQKTVITAFAVGAVVIVVLAAGFILLNGGKSNGNPATYNRLGTDAGGQNILIPLTEITNTLTLLLRCQRHGDQVLRREGRQAAQSTRRSMLATFATGQNWIGRSGTARSATIVARPSPSLVLRHR